MCQGCVSDSDGKKKKVKRERHTFNLQVCFTCTRTAGDGEQRAKFLSVSLIPVNT